MPKRSKREEREVRARLAVFCLAMFIIVVGLVLVWKRLPYGKIIVGKPVVQEPIVETTEPEPTPVATTAMVREKPVGMVCDETNAICVSEHTVSLLGKGDLPNPIHVTGTFAYHASSLFWRLEDASGTFENDLYAGRFITRPEEGPDPFEIRYFLFNAPRSSTGTLVLYDDQDPQYENENGTIIRRPTELRLPVRFGTERTNLRVVEPVDQLQWDSSSEELRVSLPLHTVTYSIPRTSKPIEATVRKIIGDQGAPSMMTYVIDVSYKNGTVYVVLAPDVNPEVSPSPWRGLIEKSLLKIPGVNKVVFGVTASGPWKPPTGP